MTFSLLGIKWNRAEFIKSKDFGIYFRSAVYYLGSSIFTAIISIVINPTMAKNLSPEDYAIIGYFTSFNLLLTPLINFNLVTYFLKNYYLIPVERRETVADTILIASLVYGAFSLIIFLVLFYVYFLLANISFNFYPYAFLAFIPVFLNIFLNFFLVECRLNREAKKYALYSVSYALIVAISSIFLVVYLKLGAVGKLSSTLIVTFVFAVYSISKTLRKFRFDFSLLKDIFHFSFPLTLSGLLYYFFTGFDRALLVGLNDNTNLGIYNVGLQIATIMTAFYSAISQTFEPDIYRAIAEDKKRKLAIYGGIIIGLNAIPNILLIFFAPLIVGLLTANRYLDSSIYSQIFAMRNITMSFYYLTITIVVGYGFTKADFLIRLFSTIPIIILMKIVVLKYEYIGAAWGQVITFVLLALFLLSFAIIKYRSGKLVVQKNRFN